jgi:ribosome-binding protein aMBF1 (putative translation factor)
MIQSNRKIKKENESENENKNKINSSINWDRLGRFFAKARCESGLSESEMVKECEMSQKTLRSFESGEKGISMDKLFCLSNVLNISPSKLLTMIHNLD